MGSVVALESARRHRRVFSRLELPRLEDVDAFLAECEEGRFFAKGRSDVQEVIALSRLIRETEELRATVVQRRSMVLVRGGPALMAIAMQMVRQPRELPMLFSAPMVNAILSGQKTVTRRVVKEPKLAKLHGRHSVPDRHFFDTGFGDGVYLHWFYGGGDLGNDAQSVRVFAPWQVGDRIWVKETFTWITGNGIRPWFRADGEQAIGTNGEPIPWEQGAHWHPSIFMPRHVSRITLEITDVRAERLQSIKEDDASAEGVEALDGTIDEARLYRLAKQMGEIATDSRVWFRYLWDQINGVPWKCWDDNPWVWRVEFRRVKP